MQCIYVSPLRALAYDIGKNLRAPIEGMGLEKELLVHARTGDTTASERAKFRRRASHILVTTPESLAVMLAQESYALHLGECQFVIVDELHSFAGNKRGADLTLSLERLERLREQAEPGAPPLCRVGLSATAAPLDLLARFLVGNDRPCRIAEAKIEKKSIVEVFSPIRRHPYPPAGYTGVRLYAELAELIKTRRSVLVFTNVRSAAEQVGMRLKELLPELAKQIEVHHASLDRNVRLEVEDRLKNGELRAVVCSTSLEMGIDIGAVDLVVMVATPKGVSRAIQRIGRSGHSLNRNSHGVLVATNINDLVEATVTARRVRERALDPVRIQQKPVDVVAQHIVGLAAVAPIAVDEVFALVRRALPFSELSREEFDRVIQYLEGGGVSLEKQYTGVFGKIRVDDGIISLAHPRVSAGLSGEHRNDRFGEFRRRPLAPTAARIGGGKLHQAAANRRPLRPWRTDCSLDRHRFAGGLRRARGWSTAHRAALECGQDAPHLRVGARSARLAQANRGSARERKGRMGESLDWLVESYEISIANAEAILEHFRAQLSVSELPVGEKMLLELYRDGEHSHYFFHSLIGRSANDALSRIVAWRVKNRIGGNALVTIDDYGFLLTLRPFQEMPLEDWRLCFEREGAEEDLFAALRGSELVKWQFRGVAQTGLMVPRHLPGRERRPKQLTWSSEVLFRVLEQHEPDHPLLEEAYRQAMHTFLDAEEAYLYLDDVQRFRWTLRELPVVSPFSFAIYASKIKESMMLEDPAAAIERIYAEMYARVQSLTCSSASLEFLSISRETVEHAGAEDGKQEGAGLATHPFPLPSEASP